MQSKAGIKTKTLAVHKEIVLEDKPDITSSDVTPVDKTVNTKKKKTRFFETYISKVLKQVANKNGITSNSKQQLNSALCIIARTISYTVIRLTEIAKKKTMSDKEVTNAVRVLFSGDLANNSIREGIKSVEKFSAESSKGSSRQGKAGIIFPPSIAEKFLRNFGYSKAMVTSTAPVFLAAVLEYLVAEILLLASKSSNINKRIRITIRDLQISVGEDKELSELFNKLNISFLGGGVIPYIHPCLASKKPRKKKKIVDTSPDAVKKPHRFRPGTVALREIKKFQKMSNCLTFAKFPFERFVRSVVNKNQNGMKISKDVFIILQYFIEQYVVGILKDANFAAIHSGRVKLMITDVEFICNLRGLSTEGFSDRPVKKESSTKKSETSTVEDDEDDEDEDDVEVDDDVEEDVDEDVDEDVEDDEDDENDELVDE
jgi:histone H3/H4